MSKRKYTKTGAKKACLACRAKFTKLYESGYMSPDLFIKMVKQIDMIHKKVG